MPTAGRNPSRIPSDSALAQQSNPGCAAPDTADRLRDRLERRTTDDPIRTSALLKAVARNPRSGHSRPFRSTVCFERAMLVVGWRREGRIATRISPGLWVRADSGERTTYDTARTAG